MVPETNIQNHIRREFTERGFSAVRFTEPPLGRAAEHFEEWLTKGYAGEMAYLGRRSEERRHPEKILPEIKSIILLAHPYDSLMENSSNPSQGNVSRYAWGEDYHTVLNKKLRALSKWLEEKAPKAHFYLSVDAQPVLEKAWAQKAGLGWMGKHTNIIDPEQGSYFFISAILTDMQFNPDPPQADRCGSCEACLRVCPTGAIVAPYVLDANRCISYLTIELKGPIPAPLRPMMGNHIFGCDDCQEVCPWNRFSQATTEGRFLPRPGIRHQPLARWLRLTAGEFKELFHDSAVSRAKWKGFMRNVLVAAGNSGDTSLAPLVKEKLTEENILVRGHAVWAYRRLLGEKAREMLEEMQNEETDVFVLEEIKEALGGSL
jgi:epoxyqueuosine reductase